MAKHFWPLIVASGAARANGSRGIANSFPCAIDQWRSKIYWLPVAWQFCSTPLVISVDLSEINVKVVCVRGAPSRLTPSASIILAHPLRYGLAGIDCQLQN
ncbi:hypothetical protein AVEN_102846-1 [Araneus ventricosus]|uniref:Uncharacterized protein n=1 Tax=Araneus ventricosus TaxID=182803 RepID=A0A4Y2CQ68_ARAVE|nr:hypothetical protein AVEN_102846-1 [Araneus ventricosus]